MEESYGQLIEPERVSFHFGAPGWYVLAALLLLLLLAIGWIWMQYKRRNAYRVAAIHELDKLVQTGQNSQLPEENVYTANMLMKRIAMMRYGRSQTAALEKDEWIGFLNHSARKEIFYAQDGGLVQTTLYSTQSAEKESGDMERFIGKSKEWIRAHKRLSN